jgi:hypothetical protein
MLLTKTTKINIMWLISRYKLYNYITVTNNLIFYFIFKILLKYSYFKIYLKYIEIGKN